MKTSLCPVAILLVIAAIGIPGFASDEIHFTGSYLWTIPAIP